METPARKTAIQKAKESLERALVQQYQAQQAVIFEGDQIILPAHMSSVADGINALQSYLKKMESATERESVVRCYPDDGLNALDVVLREKFGNVFGNVIRGFFSDLPGEVTITTGYNQSRPVVSGRIVIPGLEDDFIMEVSHRYNGEEPLQGYVRVLYKYRRKFEPYVLDIDNTWKAYLRDNSIFAGKAINSGFEFLDMTGDTSRLVYSRAERRQLEANLFSPITHRDTLRGLGVNVKRTVLLYGPYGSGKTLTALRASQLSTEYGWTFIYVRPGDSIAPSLRFAKLFQPAVVFFEDIDSEISGSERTTHVNEILNTADGIIGKNDAVMTILTTNHLNRINRAMLRPGRVDAIIKLGDLDRDSVAELVGVYSSVLNVADMTEAEKDGLHQAALKYPAAFVANATQRASMYAISGGRDAKDITVQDVIDALTELRPQYELMADVKEEVDDPMSTAFEKSVAKVVDGRFVTVEKFQEATGVPL